jgi:hypothetical protein
MSIVPQKHADAKSHFQYTSTVLYVIHAGKVSPGNNRFLCLPARETAFTETRAKYWSPNAVWTSPGVLKTQPSMHCVGFLWNFIERHSIASPSAFRAHFFFIHLWLGKNPRKGECRTLAVLKQSMLTLLTRPIPPPTPV